MKQNRVESRNYLDMTAEKPGDTEREELCFRYLLDQIPDQRIPKLLELFGGIGLFRSLVASPEYHESWDFSEDCCHHIQNKFPRTLVRRVDSFSEEIEKGFDLISADFNAWTPLKQLSDPKYKVLDRIFQALPRYVQFTDAAISKLHLNYKSYAVVIGNWVRPPPRPEEYSGAISAWVLERYGYRLIASASHSGAVYYLFQNPEYPSSSVPHRHFKSKA